MELYFLYYILYWELGICLFLYLPFFDNFKRKIVKLAEKLGMTQNLKTFGYICLTVLVIMFFLAYQERNNRFTTNFDQEHLNQFIRYVEAQRDLYLSGISVLLIPLMFRFYQLLNQYYTELASREGLARQARQAMSYNSSLLDEKSELEKENKKLKDLAFENTAEFEGEKESGNKEEVEQKRAQALTQKNEELKRNVKEKQENFKKQMKRIKNLKSNIEKEKYSQKLLHTENENIEEELENLKNKLHSGASKKAR